MNHAVRFDRELVERYDVTGPRYTSYPTALQVHEGFDAARYRRHVTISNDELIPAPLSLYLHLPYCQSLCYYCACNRKIARHAEQGIDYLARLVLEVRAQGSLFDRDRIVSQVHFGGGTPTFFDDERLGGLMAELRASFNFEASAPPESSIEIDPRTVSPERLEHLAAIGFNRFSLGIQDTDPVVQQAVNRVQDSAAALALVGQGRRCGFHSVSIDLIYGLPRQTPARFAATLDAVIEANPDRIAVYSYAHLPQLFRAQKLIPTGDLPPPGTRLELIGLTVDRLTRAGYRHIGMDHFALPGDELSQALDAGTLQRNFQGYSTRRECDLVGLGVSAISRVGDCYAQNHRDLRSWNAAVDEGRLPLWRGVSLTAEDRLRRSVIESILCRGEVVFADFERQFDIEFDEFFAAELERLGAHADDGLIEWHENRIEITAAGRLVMRAVAMVFDEHRKPDDTANRHSRVI